ncbi:MAG: branched-chain amino acid ABC transporter permease [Clostridiaceae bacterium]|nr:branched-chain amino acid ABC transporter permease [Clostridiaceae bacterium]
MDKVREKIKTKGLLFNIEHFFDRYKVIISVVFAVVALSVPFIGLSRATMRLLVMIGLYSMLGMGLNLLVGYTGQVSLGHAGFYAIGAYVCALLQVDAGVNFWLALLIGGIVSGFVGFLLGLPTLRLSGTYLSIVTLGFCEVVQMILKQWESVTYGNYGVRNIPKPELFGFTFNQQNGGFYIIILVLAVLTALGCHFIKNSKTGRAFIAIKEDELAATMMGIKTSRYKILAFVLSAFITGIAGGFYSVINNGYIEPTNFTFNISILIMSVVIVGGLGTIRGMVFGATILMLFPEVFRFLNEWRFVIYGVLLVLMMQFRPQGALGWQSTLPYRLSKETKKLLEKKKAAAEDASRTK